MTSVRWDGSLTLAAFTILYYDYSVTVLSEIQYYWSPPTRSINFLLFAVNRYIGLLGPIPVFFEYFFSTSESSAVLTSKSPLTTDIRLGFAYPRCNLALTDDQGVHLALAWSAMLWFDTIIFMLTLFKAIQMRREMSGGLIEILFRDGTIYYGILVAVNMINIITFLKTPPNTPMKGMATTMTNVLSVTLTSRLMLNLHDPSLNRGRRIGGGGTSRYEAWETTGQCSTRMMSFRHPTADVENTMLEELEMSSGSD
ncbi:hypothetical protein BD414DRAFT_533349 [Trametes punicea]|nr:hypothetical protein BD414DRAFT_533349 [Trametes punicea]